MKLQFSIAGVMGFTVVVSLGLWSLLYADHLLAHVATASLLAGGQVGWIVGASHGRAQRGCLAGVLGGLLWAGAAVLSDLHFWSHADRSVTWSGLACWAALGAVPMASVVAVYERNAYELIVRPLTSCVVAVLILGFALAIGLGVAILLYAPRQRWEEFPLVIVLYSVLLVVVCCIAMSIGAGYGALALVLRSLEAEGRKYRNAWIAKPVPPVTVTDQHQDPVTVDHSLIP
jgi:hypothetical protein